jgi:hypothetical protein
MNRRELVSPAQVLLFTGGQFCSVNDTNRGRPGVNAKEKPAILELLLSCDGDQQTPVDVLET